MKNKIKELTPLEALQNIVTNALKEKEKQDLILNFLKEHIVFEDDVVKTDFQWMVEDKETKEAIKEWLK